MYIYFKDADELVTLASMSYLENCCRTLAADIPQLSTPREIYVHTWRVFCQHAFASPRVFCHLFFYPHSQPLSETVARYYEIYPNLLSSSDVFVRDLLLAGDLSQRNRRVLQPIAAELGFDEAQTDLINELTTAYFKKLLEDHQGENGSIAAERRVQKMLDAIDLLFRTGAAR